MANYNVVWVYWIPVIVFTIVVPKDTADKPINMYLLMKHTELLK